MDSQSHPVDPMTGCSSSTHSLLAELNSTHFSSQTASLSSSFSSQNLPSSSIPPKSTSLSPQYTPFLQSFGPDTMMLSSATASNGLVNIYTASHDALMRNPLYAQLFQAYGMSKNAYDTLGKMYQDVQEIKSVIALTGGHTESPGTSLALPISGAVNGAQATQHLQEQLKVEDYRHLVKWWTQTEYEASPEFQEHKRVPHTSSTKKSRGRRSAAPSRPPGDNNSSDGEGHEEVPEAVASRRSVMHIQDPNGNLLPGCERVPDDIRIVFNEFVDEGIAIARWGEARSVHEDRLRIRVESRCEAMRWCSNGWLTLRAAAKLYPSFKQSHARNWTKNFSDKPMPEWMKSTRKGKRNLDNTRDSEQVGDSDNGPPKRTKPSTHVVSVHRRESIEEDDPLKDIGREVAATGPDGASPSLSRSPSPALLGPPAHASSPLRETAALPSATSGTNSELSPAAVQPRISDTPLSPTPILAPLPLQPTTIDSAANPPETTVLLSADVGPVPLQGPSEGKNKKKTAAPFKPRANCHNARNTFGRAWLKEHQNSTKDEFEAAWKAVEADAEQKKDWEEKARQIAAIAREKVTTSSTSTSTANRRGRRSQ